MHGIKPRTLTNGELVQYASDLLHEGVLDVAVMAEVLRRLNYHIEGQESRILRSIDDPRQLELPL